jgi:hypothetical protein
MSLPELFANSPTIGTLPSVAIAKSATELKAGETTLHTEAPAPSALQASGQFRIVISSEIMIVTAGASGTSWTVTRKAEGSTEASHPAGSSIYNVLTAGALGGQSNPEASVPGLRSLGLGATEAAAGSSALHVSPTINTDPFLVYIDGYEPGEGKNRPYHLTHLQVEIWIGGNYSYEESAVKNLFQFASYAENTGTTPTVAVFGQAAGKSVWGGNFVAYTNEAGQVAIACELDFGNQGASGGEAFGLVIAQVNAAENTGVNQGSFIQIQSNGATTHSRYGFKIQGGTNQPLSKEEGIAIYFDGIEAEYGLHFGAASKYKEAAIIFGNGQHIAFGTGEGTKIGKGEAEKLAFWGSEPTTRPTVKGNVPGDTGLSALVSALAKTGIVKNETTEAESSWVGYAASLFRPARYYAATVLDDAITPTSTAVPASGTVWCALLPIVAGSVVHGLGAYCSNVGSEIEHLWFMLLDANRHVKGYTADLASTLTAAETRGEFTAGSGSDVEIVANEGCYFAILTIYKGTAPAFRALTDTTEITNQAQIRSGNSSTGLTTVPAVGTQLAALAGDAAIFWGGAL